MEKELVYSYDGELFNIETAHEAFEQIYHNGNLMIGSEIECGEKFKVEIDFILNGIGDHIKEHAECVLWDECGESAEDAIDVTEEDLEKLERIIIRWAKKNMKINCYSVKNIKTIKATFDDVEKVLKQNNDSEELSKLYNGDLI